MNERIRRLAEQADISVKEHYDETGSTYAELEKFAELIVAECVELFPERNYYYSGLAVQRYIKTHFGVEEKNT